LIQPADEETELMGLISNLDYEASISDPTLQGLSRKGLGLITSGKCVLITKAGIDWQDVNGWSVRQLLDLSVPLAGKERHQIGDDKRRQNHRTDLGACCSNYRRTKAAPRNRRTTRRRVANRR
jgi:hypothetical protein